MEFEWETFSKILVDIQFGRFNIILKINRGCFTWLCFSRRLMEVTTPHASKDGHVSHPDNVPKVLLKARNVEPWHGPWEKELSGSRSSGSTKYFGIFAVLLWTVSITKCWLFPGIIDFKNVEEMITRITLLKKKHWSLSVYYVTFCTVIVE